MDRFLSARLEELQTARALWATQVLGDASAAARFIAGGHDPDGVALLAERLEHPELLSLLDSGPYIRRMSGRALEMALLDVVAMLLEGLIPSDRLIWAVSVLREVRSDRLASLDALQPEKLRDPLEELFDAYGSDDDEGTEGLPH